MARERYQEDLDTLRGDVMDLGDLVLKQVRTSLDALDSGDASVATEVIERDRVINERYLELESDCIDLFALQQPVASDLRFIASSFKILTDLERIGDLATNFGNYTLAGDRGLGFELDVYGIGTDATQLVEDALAAYESNDAEVCFELAERDDEIDALCLRASEQLVRDLIEREVTNGDSWEVERLLDDVSRVLLTIRDLERVGDHAVNIAARTLYMEDGNAELIY